MLLLGRGDGGSSGLPSACRRGGGCALCRLQSVTALLKPSWLQNAPKHWMLDKLGGIFVSGDRS